MKVVMPNIPNIVLKIILMRFIPAVYHLSKNNGKAHLFPILATAFQVLLDKSKIRGLEAFTTEVKLCFNTFGDTLFLMLAWPFLSISSKVEVV